jgi:hypothetical protein
LYVSPNLVELVAFGDEIVSGPDASKVFGGAAIASLPPGASATPILPAAGSAPNGLTPPGLPGIGGGTVAIGGAAGPLPGLPGAALPAVGSPPGLPGMPGLGAPPTIQYIMQPSAQGATREALHGLGWTDDMLIQHGHMVKVA